MSFMQNHPLYIIHSSSPWNVFKNKKDEKNDGNDVGFR